MPITSGAGNPKWSRDETILALDLVYRHGGAVGKNHPDAILLSALLREADIHSKLGRKPSFRNSDGVALKMQNLLSAIDPGRGLSSSKQDRSLVAEFPASRKVELAALAEEVRLRLAPQKSSSPMGFQDPPADEDWTAVEGQVRVREHRIFERDQGFRKRLLLAKTNGELRCEICSFAPPPLSRTLCESFFEAHHIVPLSHTAGERKTLLSEVALLCAGCHRFIHRLMVHESRWVGLLEARKILTEAKASSGDS